MKRIAVVTDSNSGITQAQSKELRVFVLPMPFMMEGTEYFEDINLTQEIFYKNLLDDSSISTSQPSFFSVMELWDRLLDEHDEIVHIPMSSGLSASCESAAQLALSPEYAGKVQVVNNRRISVTLRQSVIDAVTLADAGWDALRIKEYSEKVQYDSSIYIMVDTLKYLKKGGRVTPTGAAIGTVLNIKPVLQIQGDKLDSYAKARGTAKARKIMIEAMRSDFNGKFAAFSNPDKMWLHMAYTYDLDAALDFKKEVENAFPGYDIYLDNLSLSVSCHIGPGALAVACCKKVEL